MKLEGSADIGFQNWKLIDAAPVKANLKLQGARVENLLATAGQTLPVTGQLSATATVDGTAGDPRAALKINIEQPSIYGEKFDRVRAEVRYAGAGVEVISGVADLGKARILLTGAFEHPVNDYKNGRIRFDCAHAGFRAGARSEYSEDAAWSSWRVRDQSERIGGHQERRYRSR